MGILLSGVIHLLNPEVIVLGGSVSKDFEKVQKVVWEEIRSRTIAQSSRDLVIEVSKLQNPATMGAAMLAGKLQ